MNPTVKRIGLVVAGILGVLVAVYGVAAVIVNFLVDPETLSSWVEPRMEAALNRPVELEGARVRIFPTLAAELQGVEVGNLPDFEGPPLAQVEGVRLEVAILPLFRGRVRVDEVRVDDPRVYLAVNADGVSNYGDLVPEAREVEPGEDSSPLELAVREILVRAADLTYENVPDTLRFEMIGLEADASLERAGTGGEWTGEVRAGSEWISLGHPALGSDPLVLDGPGVRGAASAGEEFDWVEIRDGALLLGGAEVALSGRMENLKEPARTVDLALESEALGIPAMFELLPDSVAAGIPGRGTGTLAVDLRIRGTVGPGERPLVRGQIRLQDVGFVDGSDRVLAQDIGGVLDVREDAVAIQDIRGSALGGPFGVGGTLSPDSVLGFRLSVTARPSLSQAAVLAPLPEGTELAGTVDADLQLAGTAREPYRTTLDGRIDAVGVRFAQPRMGVPLAVDSARVIFAGDRASWQDVGLALGEDRLTVSGSVSSPLGVLGPDGELVPRLDADVAGSRLNLDRILPARSDTAVTYGRIAFARMGGRTIQGRTAEEWATEKGLSLPDSVPAAGRIRIALDTVISSPFRLEGVDANVDFSPTLVAVTDSRFTLYGGEVTTGVQMGVGGADTQPFSLSLRTQGIRGGDFLATTSSLGRHVSGLLDLDLDVAGEMDRQMLPVPGTVSGGATSTLRDGRLEETPLTRTLSQVLSLATLASPTIQRWTARMQVEGPTVRFVESEMTTELGPLAYGGTVGLDGSLNLGLRLSLASARVDSLALQQSGFLGAVAGRLTGAGGGGASRLGIGIAVRGTLSDPELSPQSSLASTVGGAIGEVVGESLNQVRDTARARLEAARDTVAERTEAVRDTVAGRVRAEREEAEARARQEAEEARRELENRAQGFLRGVLGGGRRQPADTAADTTGAVGDTTGAPADTTAAPGDTTSTNPG